MKKITVAIISVVLLTLGAYAKDLKVLTIGNSFAESVFRYLPKIAKAEGKSLCLKARTTAAASCKGTGPTLRRRKLRQT